MRKIALVGIVALLVTMVTPVSAADTRPDGEFEVLDVANGEGWKTSGDVHVVSGRRWVVEFSASANLAALADFDDRTERIAATRELLVATARASQATARAVLDAAAVPYRSFWLSNQIVFDGPRALVADLAALDGVSLVRRERVYPKMEPVAVGNADAAPEWGVSRIGADLAWEDGILGDGIVVGGIDGGVEYTHSALVENYRGNLGGGSFDHNYNWFDPTGICGPEPCPGPDGHGTHTMGTAVGGDGPGPYEPDIGVAPGARWIAAKGCEDFECTEQSLLAAAEWMLAPTDLNGENPDPAMAPHVVNNSWGGPPGDPLFLDIVNAWVAAGIVPVFSSGNPGPFCGDGGSPGDYNEAFSVGATDIDDVIGEFSGRGPSAFGKINPDVAAPGIDILSSFPGDSFEFFTGTSMAAPHATGAMALLMSAAPSLVSDPPAAMNVLRSTALDIFDDSCGGDPSGDPNNVYGDGRIDAYLAVLVAQVGGTLAGTVVDAATGSAIEGAEVTATGGEFAATARTDAAGTYSMLIPEGVYDVSVTAFGYVPSTVEATIVQDETTIVDVALDLAPRYELSGVVRRFGTGAPVPGVEVSILGAPVDPSTTDSDGRYSFEVPAGTYVVQAAASGCETGEPVTVNVAGPTTADLTITPKLDNFGHGCRTVDFRWVDASIQSALFGDDTVGRLRLPFEIEFYGDTYDALFIDSNGYAALARLEFSDFFNRPIPDFQPPDAAIYAFWHDFVIDEEAHIDYDFTKSGAVNGVILEYVNVISLINGERANFELKIWENGVVDMLYGPGIEAVGGGDIATIGIEGPRSDDALEYSFNTTSVSEGTAIRFEPVTSALLTGSVLNLNNNKPVANATVVTEPGGRFTTTDDAGRFAIPMLPGTYTVGASAFRYGEGTVDVTIAEGDVAEVSILLPAARARIRPKSIDATGVAGERTKVKVKVRNTGTLPLEWSATDSEAVEQLSRFVTRPTPYRAPAWAPQAVTRPNGLGSLADHIGVRAIVVEDPIGDAERPPDVASIDAEFAGDDAIFTVVTEGPINEWGGFMLFDTDQDPATGVPGEEFFGRPEQELGVEVLVDLFGVFEGVVFIVDPVAGELIAEGPAQVDGNTLTFALPAAALEGPTGVVNMGLVAGDFEGPTDWVPDIGSAEVVVGGVDAKWIRVKPDSGVVAPGDKVKVKVILRGQKLDPGLYRGIVTFRSDDPIKTRIEIPVTFTVLATPIAIDPIPLM